MREIKFRAWNKKEKCMYLDPHISDGSVGDYCTLLNKGIKYTFSKKFILMQYIGLKDKNNVEIYEGDIVQFQGLDDYGQGIVEWEDDSFYAKYLHNPDIGGYDLMYHIWKVIGNIYQNPELIKE